MRRAAVLALAGALLFSAAAVSLWRDRRASLSSESVREAGEGCRVPVTILKNSGPTAADVVVLHGLIANRSIMLPMARALHRAGMRVLVLDLPGHGNNRQSFSFPRAEECARAAVRELARSGEIRPERTVLLGHSLGGAIALRMAEVLPEAAATIAVSPAPFYVPAWAPPAFLPYSLPPRLPRNILILMGAYDLPFAAGGNRRVIRDAGGPRESQVDFAAGRAARFAIVQGSSHTGMLFTDALHREVVRWIDRSVNWKSPRVPHELRGASLLQFQAGTLGLLLMSPLVASLLAGLLRIRRAPQWEATRFQHAATWWLLAGLLSVGVLKLGVPLRFLRLYSGAYFASFVLLAGLVLCALAEWKTRRLWAALQVGRADWRDRWMGIGFGLLMVLAFAPWLDAAIYDAWPTAERWLRVPALVLACLPLALVEELVTGAPPPLVAEGGWQALPGRAVQRSRRLVLFLLRRFLLWLSVSAGVLLLGSGEILLLLLPVYLTLFSIGQRLAGDAVWRRTASPLAAALCSAILAGWLMALFPIS